MTPKKLRNTSKFLSLLLRHKPQIVGLDLDPEGWADTQELLQKINAHGHILTLEELQQVVAQNDKQRFAFSADGTRIRANQGHSVTVDLDLHPVAPPEVLYHGTAERNLSSIREKGLLKRKRHHVHLSPDELTARKVGMRYGNPVVLCVAAARMHAEGAVFYQSTNGVWLTDEVPVVYIGF